MIVWQRIGSICTTDSAAGSEKLRQKATAIFRLLAMVKRRASPSCTTECVKSLIILHRVNKDNNDYRD